MQSDRAAPRGQPGGVARTAGTGRDPREFGPIWQALFTGGYKLGHGGIVAHAIAASISRCGTSGKDAGLSSTRPPWSAHRREVELMPRSGALDQSIEVEVERVQRAVAQGYRSVKLHLDKRWGFDSEPDRTIELMTAVRRSVGDNIDLLADMEQRIHLADCDPGRTGVRGNSGFATSKSRFRPTTSKATGICSMRWTYRSRQGNRNARAGSSTCWPEAGRVGILMPDVIKTYGISETMRIGDIAQTHNVPIVCPQRLSDHQYSGAPAFLGGGEDVLQAARIRRRHRSAQGRIHLVRRLATAIKWESFSAVPARDRHRNR